MLRLRSAGPAATVDAEGRLADIGRRGVDAPRVGITARAIKAFRRDKLLYFMLALPLTYFVVFHYVPMYGIVLAFKDFNIGVGIWDSPWVGLKHFQEFLSNPYAWTLISNTVILRLWQLVVFFPAPIVIALFLDELTHERFKRLVQNSSYLPHFISVVVVSGMIVSFLASDGPVSGLVRFFGGRPLPWLQTPELFRPIYTFSGVWQDAGWVSVIYVAALMSISPELHEAAVIDGANRLQRIRHVSLPGIAPVITIMFLLRVGQILTVDFQKILLLYTPATYETADVLGTYIYRRGILGADFSYATAIGLFQAVVGLVFIVVANAIAKRTSGTSLW